MPERQDVPRGFVDEVPPHVTDAQRGVQRADERDAGDGQQTASDLQAMAPSSANCMSYSLR